MEKAKIRLDTIVSQMRFQPREKIDESTVAEYTESWKAKAKFPPIDVFTTDRVTYLLAHGFHRYMSATRAGLTKIEANIHVGGEREAKLFACGANADQEKVGLRRTNADKRYAVKMLLGDPEWAKRSVNWIAQTCRVSGNLVRDVFKKGSCSSARSRVKAPDGRTFPAHRPPRAKPKPKAGEGTLPSGEAQEPTNGSTPTAERSLERIQEEAANLFQEVKDWNDRLAELFAAIRTHGELFEVVNVRRQVPDLTRLYAMIRKIRDSYIEDQDEGSVES